MRRQRVDNFLRIAGALKNPGAQPWQYRVKSFGYCTLCEKLVEHQSNASQESLYEKCMACGKDSSSAFGEFRSFILTGSMIPAALQQELEHLQSREKQMEFFRDALTAYIGELREEKREKIRELAPLESDIFTLVALFDATPKSDEETSEQTKGE